MFISYVLKQQECKSEASNDLRKLGIRSKPKKIKQNTHKYDNKVFRIPLGVLPTVTVTLYTGQQIVVPEIVDEMCSVILNGVKAEGVFRKEGSKARQSEIKTMLRNKGHLKGNHNVIDVAVVLKLFLRELPEPVIPYGFHDLFLKCILLKDQQLEAVLLACLLLPNEHLNTLAYLLQFFFHVTEYANSNKMDSYNLAVVMGPNLFPVEDKLCPNPRMRTDKTCDLIKLLIENATKVGVIPEDIIRRVGNNATGQPDAEKKKKRRSGSLTRMFSGLKKIVGGKSLEESPSLVTPDLLITPIASMRKRKNPTTGLSNKKKKEILSTLPNNALLRTPFTPQRTPICMDLRGDSSQENKIRNEDSKEKKSQWFGRSKSVKTLKQDEANKENSENSKSALQRRWSALGQPSNLKKTKMRNSCAATLSHVKLQAPENRQEPDYIRVPITEYEAIKNRVSRIEKRISIEMESVQSRINNENNSIAEADNNVEKVQSVYEQTLEQTGQLSPTTDHLAKRLSRELKIRRSGEQKIIRSPSARKIGSMRRRSRESDRNTSRLSRHQSWHVTSKSTISYREPKSENRTPNKDLNKNMFSGRKEMAQSRTSVGGQGSQVLCNLSGSSSDTWVSAEGFFATLSSARNSLVTSRSSLAKLRSQNAGMVLAKAKLFDQMKNFDGSGSNMSLKRVPRIRMSKIGSSRNVDNHLSSRVRMLKNEDKKPKKIASPRRRNVQMSRQKLQLAKKLVDSSLDHSSEKENQQENFKDVIPILGQGNPVTGEYVLSPKFSTPRTTPHIKRPFHLKSPKRLCRTTPIRLERGTPLKALRTPVHHKV